MTLQPVVEPNDSTWRGLLDAYERSGEVYRSEWEMLDKKDPNRKAVAARGQEFFDAADALREEHRVALAYEGLVDEAMSTSERSLYAQGKRFGVSDIGGCRRYVQFLIDDEEFSDPRADFLAAYVGTAVGTKLEDDYIALRNPHAISQMTITVPIEVIVDGEVFTISVPGHPDLVEPAEHGNAVHDEKTKDGLGVVIRENGEQKHKIQLSLYAHALIGMGVITKDARLALVYYDRSGAEQTPHVVEWTYDEAIYEEAVAWLSDVVYAQVHGEEASKDMPMHFCESFCPMFSKCRGTETDVQGVIRDPHILHAIEVYDEAHEREKAAAKDKKAAAAELRGIAGHTPNGGMWRWITVGESKIEPHVRRGYERVSWTKPKAKK